MTPSVVLGCPVANRAWILPEWFAAIDRQTIRPSRCVFVHGGEIGDDTWDAILDWSIGTGTPVSLRHDRAPVHERSDQTRFETLARLRNELLDLALVSAHCEVFVSLDSDILLGADDTIERLVNALDDADIAAPRVSLTPSPNGFAFNAGLWAEPTLERHFEPGQEPWHRCKPTDAVQPVHFPMAAWAAKREVIERCRYSWHESGEDMGFGLSLIKHRFRSVWLTDLQAVHVWNDRLLEEMAEYAETLR